MTLGVWVGSVVFFSFIAAPTLFGALGKETAGRAVSAIFPRYYALGAVCGAVAIVSGLLLGARQAAWGRSLLVEMVIVLLMVGAVGYAGWVLLPQAAQARLDRARAADGSSEQAEAQARFASLHRRSVLLNGAVLLLGLTAFLLAAIERPPR